MTFVSNLDWTALELYVSRTASAIFMAFSFSRETGLSFLNSGRAFLGVVLFSDYGFHALVHKYPSLRILRLTLLFLRPIPARVWKFLNTHK